MRETEQRHYQGFLKAAATEIKQHMFRDQETQIILSLLSGIKGKALEIGSNLGHLAERISEDPNNQLQITGIDTNNSKFVHQTAKMRTGSRGNFLHASGEQTPFPDQSFEIVLLSHVLEHLEKPEIMLNEIKRILKANGKLIIAVPKEKYLGELSKDHKILFTSPKELVELLQRFGFKIIDTADLTRSIVAEAKLSDSKIVP